MGMFDTVKFECPACGEETSFQTKDGECTLKTYGLKNMPGAIAEGLKNKSIYCNHCEISIGFETFVEVRVKAVVARPT
jgi:transcription elongation factor Elf1